MERGLAALMQRSLSDILEQRIRDDQTLGKPSEAASHYISRGTRHTLKHIALLDVLTAEMQEEFDLKEAPIAGERLAI